MIADLNGQRIEIKRAHFYPGEGERYLIRVYGPKGGERFVGLIDQQALEGIKRMIAEAEAAP